MKITPRQLKSKFKERSFITLVAAGLVFGLLANIASNIDASVSVIVSWTLPLVAIVVGYYQVGTAKGVRSFSSKLALVTRGSVLFVLASSISAFLVNFIAITFGQGWGLGGMNMASMVGIVSLILGIIVGFLSQSIIFILFGMIGGAMARSKGT